MFQQHVFKPIIFVITLSFGLTLNGCASMFGGKDNTVKGLPKNSEAIYYKEAKKQLDNKRYELAEKAINELLTFYPVGSYSKQAQLDLIYIKYKKSEYQQAALAADRFLKSYPSHPKADYAQYVKGVANMNGGYGGIMKYTNLKQAHRDTSYLRAAFADFKKMIQNYPNSPYISDSIDRMHHIYNQLAEHEINVARFNIERKAYLGAIERARWVFQYYPQSPQTPEAVATMAYAYDKLGMTTHADRYKKILRDNFPSLISGNDVQLAAARTSASLMNKLSLGLFGRASDTATYIKKTKDDSITNYGIKAPDSLENKDKQTDYSEKTNLSQLGELENNTNNYLKDPGFLLPSDLPQSKQ